MCQNGLKGSIPDVLNKSRKYLCYKIMNEMQNDDHVGRNGGKQNGERRTSAVIDRRKVESAAQIEHEVKHYAASRNTI